MFAQEILDLFLCYFFLLIVLLNSFIHYSFWHIFSNKGHTRQGLRCRNCKSNVHVDCAAQLTKCQAKQKLLRRQKSTSEIVTNRVDMDDSKYYILAKCTLLNENKHKKTILIISVCVCANPKLKENETKRKKAICELPNCVIGNEFLHTHIRLSTQSSHVTYYILVLSIRNFSVCWLNR